MTEVVSMSYFRIHRKFGVPYGEVLRLVQWLDDHPNRTLWAMWHCKPGILREWESALVTAWQNEQERRK